jgi:hypothetical protein
MLEAAQGKGAPPAPHRLLADSDESARVEPTVGNGERCRRVLFFLDVLAEQPEVVDPVSGSQAS